MRRTEPGFRGFPSFLFGYGVLAAALLAMLVFHKRMPMVDMPGHVSQIGSWLHYADPAYGFKDEFEFNWFTPYFFGYGLVYLLSHLFSIHTAFKIVLALAALSMPLVVRRTLVRGQGEPYWALFALPAFFGHAFHWGFLNYLIALPIGLLAIELSRRLSDDPAPRRALRLLAVLALLFFAHGIVFAWAWTVGFLICVLPPGYDVRRRIWPFFAVALIPAFYSSLKGESIPTETIWNWQWSRIAQLLAAPLTPRDPHAVAFGALLLALMLIVSGGVRKPSREHLPFLVALVAYLFAPVRMLNTDFIYQRLDVFVAVGFLAILPMPPTPGRRLAARLIVLVCSLLFFGQLATRFAHYNRSVSGFDGVAQAIPMNSRVRMVDPAASGVIHPFHLLDQELIAFRGAVVDNPWARYWQMPLRIRKEYVRASAPEFIVLRDSTRSCAADPVAEAASGIPRLRFQSGNWCLFELLDAGEIEAGEQVDGIQRPAADLVEDAADVLPEDADRE